MVSCEDGVQIVTSQIAASWGKFVFTSIHHFGERVTIKTKSDGGHLRYSIAAIDHMATPCIHNLPKLREIIRGFIFISLFNFIVSANIPEISPFCIKWRRRRRNWCVLFRVVAETLAMVFSLLLIFGCSPNLIILLWINVFSWFFLIIGFWSGIEIFF